MQSETGCKINVSQASGADIEREIGLVGSRQAIDDAKQAIWDKVDQVVSKIQSLSKKLLTPRRKRRTTADGVVRVAKITTTHNRRLSHRTVRLHPKASLPRHPLQAPQPAVQQTPMLSTAATRTIWPCGTRRLPSSSSKEARRPARLVLRLLRSFFPSCPVIMHMMLRPLPEKRKTTKRTPPPA